MSSNESPYRSTSESLRIFDLLLNLINDGISLPSEVQSKRSNVIFTGDRDLPYFPIPFKETETTAALKAVEGCVATLLADIKYGTGESRRITVNHEKTTAFLFQAYLARIGGLGKLDKSVGQLLKGRQMIVQPPSYG